MAWIGTVSYGVFLWHLPLLKAIAHTPAYDWVGGRPFPSLWITIVPLSLLAGWLSYVLVERPAIAWGRRIGVQAENTPGAGLDGGGLSPVAASSPWRLRRPRSRGRWRWEPVTSLAAPTSIGDSVWRQDAATSLAVVLR